MAQSAAVILAALLAGAARAQQSALDGASVPPPVSLKVTDEAAEVGFRPSWNPGSWTLTPVLRGGVLAPFGALPVPFSILETSPYGVVGFDLRYSKAVESLVMATAGYTELLSHKGIADPGGAAASPASHLPDQTHFSQQTIVGSAYADIGKVTSPSSSVKASFFAAVDAFGLTSLTGAAGISNATGFGESNAGAIVMYKKGQTEASAFADLRGEAAPQNMFSNYAYTVVPAGTFGAEYARVYAETHRVAAGVEATMQRADIGLRPYATWSHDKVSALVAGDFRRSNDDFYPDVAGGGAEVRVRVARGVQLGVLGNFRQEKYSLAPGPANAAEAMGTLTVDFGKFFHSEVSSRMRQLQAAGYQAQNSYDMNSRLPNGIDAGAAMSAFAQSPTFSDFVKNFPVRGSGADGILAAASAFTASFSNRNYNYNEATVPNAANVDEIYRRARAGSDPMLVCIGSSQFAAVLAEALGKQAGVPIEAMAVGNIRVPDDNGQGAGHAVAAVKTQPYGIVFIDWGKLTPTYTFDTSMALRIYQALQGIPSIYHMVTAGNEGHEVGYLFTDEGKAIANYLTFHDELPKPFLAHLFNDAPQGAPLTIERFKELTRRQF